MALLCFLDDSADSQHCFYSAVIADGGQVAHAEAHLDRLADWVSSRGLHAAEFHAHEIMNEEGPWSRTFSIEERIGVIHSILSTVPAYGLVVVTRGIRLEAYRAKYSSDPYDAVFTNLLERINEYLTHEEAHAVLIADRSRREQVMRAELSAGQRHSTGLGYRAQQLSQIRDTAHFVDSKLSRMVQVADSIAYVRRRRARGTMSDARSEVALSELMALITAGVPGGQYDTIW